MIYRTRKRADPNDQVWHWRRNCSLWPRKNYVQVVNAVSAVQHPPRPGEQCNQCRAKDRKATK